MGSDIEQYEFFQWRGKAYTLPPDEFLVYEMVENKCFYLRGQISTFFNEAVSISQKEAFELAKENKLIEWLKLEKETHFESETVL